jgi:LSD1 subclass zinc finger protein
VAERTILDADGEVAMPELETVRCGGCGAPLEVPHSATFVTCRFCNTALRVQRNESVVFTEVLQSLEEKTDRLVETTELLRLENELHRLDRDWDQQAAKLMVRDKNGSRQPSHTAAAIGGPIAIVFGVIWTIVAGAMFPPMALFGLVFIGIAVWGMLHESQKASEWERKRRAYDARRLVVQSQLDQLRGESRTV